MFFRSFASCIVVSSAAVCVWYKGAAGTEGCNSVAGKELEDCSLLVKDDKCKAGTNCDWVQDGDKFDKKCKKGDKKWTCSAGCTHKDSFGAESAACQKDTKKDDCNKASDAQKTAGSTCEWREFSGTKMCVHSAVVTPAKVGMACRNNTKKDACEKEEAASAMVNHANSRTVSALAMVAGLVGVSLLA